jgi:transposase InsO family protein
MGGTLPDQDTTAVESASCIFQHFGRFGNAEVVHTDRGTAFHNELIEELLRMSGTEQSLTTANSSEENGIAERANQEVLRHLNAILFDSRVHDKWSFEQLPMVQRIMNTVEKTSTVAEGNVSTGYNKAGSPSSTVRSHGRVDLAADNPDHGSTG